MLCVTALSVILGLPAVAAARSYPAEPAAMFNGSPFFPTALSGDGSLVAFASPSAGIATVANLKDGGIDERHGGSPEGHRRLTGIGAAGTIRSGRPPSVPTLVRNDFDRKEDIIAVEVRLS